MASLEDLIATHLEAVKEVLCKAAANAESEIFALRLENSALNATRSSGRAPDGDFPTCSLNAPVEEYSLVDPPVPFRESGSAISLREVWKPEPPPVSIRTSSLEPPSGVSPLVVMEAKDSKLSTATASTEEVSAYKESESVRSSKYDKRVSFREDGDSDDEMQAPTDPQNTTSAFHFVRTYEEPSRRGSANGNRLFASSWTTYETKAATGPPQSVFADADEMKRKVRAALAQGAYDVKTFYKETGPCQHIARSSTFEVFTLMVIFTNAIWIGVEVDLNSSATLVGADPFFQVVENLFCFYFAFEWFVRAMAFKDKKQCWHDSWFIFDGSLLAIMVFETWVVSILFLAADFDTSKGAPGGGGVLKIIRVVRLSRMARMARLLQAFPELQILVKGIVVASRSVFFTLILLLIIIYFFAIMFRQVTDGTPIGERYYASVFAAMSSLLLDYILPDQSAPIRDHGDANIGLSLLALVFMLLAGLTVMNMLVGVLVEVVSVVSSVEKEQLTVGYVKTRLDQIFKQLENNDVDGNKSISQSEFQHLLVQPEAVKIIQEIGVDVYALVDISNFIFQDGRELKFPEFMEMVLQLRGSNTATVKDIVDLRKFLYSYITSQDTHGLRKAASEPASSHARSFGAESRRTSVDSETRNRSPGLSCLGITTSHIGSSDDLGNSAGIDGDA